MGAPVRWDTFLGGGTALIFHGHALECLRSLPSGSIHACVTSPPYWPMRSNPVDASVWGGSPDCPHEWTTVRVRRPNQSGGKSEKQLTSPGSFAVDYHDRAVYSDRCLHCGGWRGQLGQEPTWQEYVENLVSVFREVRRVLRRDGVVALNLGDAYDPKGGKLLIPHRVGIALTADGWMCQSDCPWVKKNPMPDSVEKRPTQVHEFVFLLSRGPAYFWDHVAVEEPAADGGTRKMRSVIVTKSEPFKASSVGVADVDHYAPFPTALPRPFIRAGVPEKTCPECGAGWVRDIEFGEKDPKTKRRPRTVKGWLPCCACLTDIKDAVPGVVLDLFGGTGTTGVEAMRNGRRAVLCEQASDYVRISTARLTAEKLGEVGVRSIGKEPGQ